MTRFFFPLLIAALYFVCLQTLCDDQRKFNLWPYVQIRITNGLPNTPSPLRFRCQSKDEDLGTHTLSSGQEFSWKFTYNYLNRSTLYFCHFYWGDMDKSFDVYNYHLEVICYGFFSRHCDWIAKPDGFYLGRDNNPLWIKVNSWT